MPANEKPFLEFTDRDILTSHERTCIAFLRLHRLYSAISKGFFRGFSLMCNKDGSYNVKMATFVVTL